ncbi:MAG TPA: SRPBCC family protein [Longimicrobiales bacterium]
MQTNEAIEREEDRQIVTTRVIDGPRRLVYEAWTDPHHLARWFGPHGFSITTHAFEFRPGGVWEFDIHGPDGTTYPNRVEWREIVPGERIVYWQGSRAEDPDAFETTVTFADRDGGTAITLRSLFKTKAQRDYVVVHYCADEGGRETIERLGAYVAELASIAA